VDTVYKPRPARKLEVSLRENYSSGRGHGLTAYVKKIFPYFQWNGQTVRETLHRWHNDGLGGAWEAKGGVANRAGKRMTWLIWQRASARMSAPTIVSN